MADSDYNSSDDEDYVPEAGAGDIEDEPSGDEVEEVTGEDGTVVSGKRRRGKNGKADKSVEEPKRELKSAAASIDADALLAMLEDEDPILSRYKNTEQEKAEEDSSAGKSNDTKVPEEDNDNCSAPSTSKEPASTSAQSGSETTVITEVFDFAGDEVKVQREVTLDELREKEAKEAKLAEAPKKPQKRLGLGGALNLIAKKPKMSVLDKSNHDWKSFKDEHKIEEELSTFNKGKDGYLNKMDFLNRTDLREFENEKAMRNAQRKK